MFWRKIISPSLSNTFSACCGSNIKFSVIRVSQAVKNQQVTEAIIMPLYFELFLLILRSVRLSKKDSSTINELFTDISVGMSLHYQSATLWVEYLVLSSLIRLSPCNNSAVTAVNRAPENPSKGVARSLSSGLEFRPKVPCHAPYEVQRQVLAPVSIDIPVDKGHETLLDHRAEFGIFGLVPT